MINLKNSILSGDFETGEKICSNISYKDLEEELTRLAFDTEEISIYLFVLYLLHKHENADLDYIASELLVAVYTFLPGAYYLAYQHLLKACILEPNNYEYKESLLLFYEIPEKVIDKIQAREIAREVLKKKPNSEIARKIIKE